MYNVNEKEALRLVLRKMQRASVRAKKAADALEWWMTNRGMHPLCQSCESPIVNAPLKVVHTKDDRMVLCSACYQQRKEDQCLS